MSDDESKSDAWSESARQDQSGSEQTIEQELEAEIVVLRAQMSATEDRAVRLQAEAQNMMRRVRGHDQQLRASARPGFR